MRRLGARKYRDGGDNKTSRSCELGPNLETKNSVLGVDEFEAVFCSILISFAYLRGVDDTSKKVCLSWVRR